MAIPIYVDTSLALDDDLDSYSPSECHDWLTKVEGAEPEPDPVWKYVPLPCHPLICIDADD